MNEEFLSDMKDIISRLQYCGDEANRNSIGQVAIAYGMTALARSLVETSRNLIKMAEKFRS